MFLYALINPSIAYCGGYTTRNKLNRNYAVSYEGFGTDFAALVLSATHDRLKVLLCNLTDKPLAGRMRIWRLDHGEYEMTLGPDANGDDQMDQVAIRENRELERGSAVDLVLKGRTSVVELRQVKKLDDICARPDLALSAMEIKVENGKLTGARPQHRLG